MEILLPLVICLTSFATGHLRSSGFWKSRLLAERAHNEAHVEALKILLDNNEITIDNLKAEILRLEGEGRNRS